MARVSQEPPCPPNLEWLFDGLPGSDALIERLKAFGRDRLIAIILQLLGWIAALRGDDKNLRARLSQNSRNSSRPPSSDGPDKPAPQSQRKKTGRQSGGQPGHKGVVIEMKKVANQYEFCKIDLSEDCDCGAPLSLTELLKDVSKRQLWEVPPPPQLHVTEWQAEHRRCKKCGKVHIAEFPKDITEPVQYGPGAQGIVFYLSQYQLIPYKRNQELMHDLFGVDMSQGTIHNIRKRAHKALWPFDVRMTALMVSMDLLHFDETGIHVKDRKDKYWMHVACTKFHTLFHADRRRGTWGMTRMGILPGFKGIAVHDHWDSYFTFLLCAHVLCNAHHLRELTYAHEQYQQAWAKKILDCLVEANDAVIAAKAEGKAALSAKQLAHFSDRFDSALQEGRKEVLLLPAPKPKKPNKGGKPAQHKIKNLFDRLIEFKVATLAFMYDFSVPFSNNQGERDIRMLKVMLKISGCFRSVLGAKMFARARSYISTAKKQGINVLEAVTAIFSGEAGPIIRRMTKPLT
jgi:transposase